MRRRLLIAAGAVTALLLAFAGGRWSRKPPAPLTREVVKTVTVDRIVQAAAEVRTVTVAGPVRVVTRVVREPGGTVREERTEERGPVTATVARVERTSEATREHVATRTQLAPERPRWMVGALAGWDLRSSRLVYGAHAGVRILGPVSVGAWAVPQLRAGGLAIGVSW